jgi:hypothetical protein
MGDYKTIFDISSALKDFLSKHSQEDNSSFIFKNTDFTLSPPEKVSQSNSSPKPKISIYLYKINENTNLRDEEIVNSVQFENDKAKLSKKHSIFLSLFYLITPVQSEDKETDIQQNYDSLGKILQIFSKHRILTDDILPSNLKGENIKIYLNPISLDDLNKIWTILSKDELYKLSISIEVSPVRIDSVSIPPVTRVKERKLDYELKREDTGT